LTIIYNSIYQKTCSKTTGMIAYFVYAVPTGNLWQKSGFICSKFNVK